MISLIIPTFNEVDNLQIIVEKVHSIFRKNDMEVEIIIVDDDSSDGTGQLAEELKIKFPIIVLHRKMRKGLSSAVIDGFSVATGSILGVIDADLSHDVCLVPKLVNAIKNDGIEIAIGSRYTDGGGVDKSWPLKKILISRLASIPARFFTSVKDPLSGFFFINKKILTGVRLNDFGFKICLEILVKAKYKLVREVPYTFTDRTKGESKLNWEVIFGFIFQLITLIIFRITQKSKTIKND